jgi:hypothetical protein
MNHDLVFRILLLACYVPSQLVRQYTFYGKIRMQRL